MKFEYDVDNNEKECVAFIHKNGALVIKDGNETIVLNGSICKAYTTELSNFYFWIAEATKKFYEGDKITITF